MTLFSDKFISKVKTNDYLFESLTIILILFFPLWILSHDYVIDWDILRYSIDVKMHNQGDTSFSYAHNLIKTFMYYVAVVVGKFTGTLDSLYAAKILTFISSSFTSFCIYLSIKKISKRKSLAALASFYWFLIPVNYYHILIAEDNVWANAVNALWIYFFIIIITEFEDNIKKIYVMAGLCGLFVSIGINIHQQIVPLFYLTIITYIILFRNNREKFLSVFYFILTYSAASFIQNYIAFGKCYMFESFKRLVFQPYAKVFPHLWFFSSEDSVCQWRIKILDGLKKSFFIGETEIPVLLFFLLFVSTAAIFFIIRDVLLKRKNNILYIFIFLIAAICIHVPHTLVYEPWNPERWDIVNPSLVILLFISVHILILKLNLKKKASLFIYSAIAVLSIFTAVQSYKFIKKITYWSENGVPMANLNSILSYLGKIDRLSKNDVILLDETMRWFFFDERVTYHSPNTHVITLSDSLEVVYSSSEQQNWNKPYSKKYFFDNKFDDNKIFHAMPSVKKNIEKLNKNFIETNKIYEIKLH